VDKRAEKYLSINEIIILSRKVGVTYFSQALYVKIYYIFKVREKVQEFIQVAALTYFSQTLCCVFAIVYVVPSYGLQLGVMQHQNHEMLF
jgi:hypothetical protein